MILVSIGKGNLCPNGMNLSIFSKGWIELVILNIKVGRFFCFSISFFATNNIAQASQVEADEGGGK